MQMLYFPAPTKTILLSSDLRASDLDKILNLWESLFPRMWNEESNTHHAGLWEGEVPSAEAVLFSFTECKQDKSRYGLNCLLGMEVGMGREWGG